MNRIRVVVAVLVILVIVLAGYVLVSQNPEKTKTPTVVGATIKAGIASIDVVDADKDIQKQAGVNFTVLRLTTPPQVIDAVLRGDAQIITVPVELAAVAMERGGDVYIIAVDYDLNQAILTRPDTGITSPADLKGKKVAAVVGSGTYALFKAFMKELYNLTVGEGEGYDIQIVNLAPPTVVDALVNGDVDAAVIWEPLVSQAIVKYGMKVVATYQELWRQYAGDMPAPMLVWVATSDIAKNKTLLDKVLKAHQLAAEKWNKNEDNWTVNFLANAYNVDPSVARSIWERDPMHSEACIPDNLVESMVKIWGLAKEAGYIQEIPSTDRIITCSQG